MRMKVMVTFMRVTASCSEGSVIIQEGPQLAAAAWMLELAQGLGLDLADTFTRDVELLADFFKRVVGVHANAETHTQHTFLTRGERRQNPRG